MQSTSANFSNAWQLDKILPPSRWPSRLYWLGWSVALVATGVAGISLPWKAGLLLLIVVIMRLTRRRRAQVRSISANKHRCIIRLTRGDHIEFAPPYHASYMTWWISLNHREGFTGRWLWLYRDQFTDNEWRQLTTLLRHSR